MKCIDFDKAFSLFAMKWFKDHAKEYKNYDAMEAAMPEVYDRFLDAPADFLAGAKPGEYFRQWDDATGWRITSSRRCPCPICC